MDWLSALLYSSVALLAIMDPFLSLGPFLSLTRKFSDAERRASADKAIEVAGFLAVFFLFAGPFVMGVLGISFESFRVAGGIVLGLLGLEMVFSFSISKRAANAGKDGVAVLIGTPILTGPGLLTVMILLAEQHGVFITLAALLAALAASWALLRQASAINRAVGPSVVEVFSRVMGLLLLAMAVEFVRLGLLPI